MFRRAFFKNYGLHYKLVYICFVRGSKTNKWIHNSSTAIVLTVFGIYHYIKVKQENHESIA